MPVTENNIENDERGANGDGGIRDVEGWVVVRAEPHLEEVRDRAMDDAVGDVARRSAEKKREADCGQRAAAVPGDEKPTERADDEDRACDQGYAQPRRGRVRENAESNARVAAVDKINKMADQLAAPALGSL